jgi:hypothetical protein
LPPLDYERAEEKAENTDGAATFKELSPGSPEWKAFWREHPEQQDAMLAWQTELRGNANGKETK